MAGCRRRAIISPPRSKSRAPLSSAGFQVQAFRCQASASRREPGICIGFEAAVGEPSETLDRIRAWLASTQPARAELSEAPSRPGLRSGRWERARNLPHRGSTLRALRPQQHQTAGPGELARTRRDRLHHHLTSSPSLTPARRLGRRRMGRRRLGRARPRRRLVPSARCPTGPGRLGSDSATSHLVAHLGPLRGGHPRDSGLHLDTGCRDVVRELSGSMAWCGGQRKTSRRTSCSRSRTLPDHGSHLHDGAWPRARCLGSGAAGLSLDPRE